MLEKNNIPIIYNKYNNPYTTRYSLCTRRYSLDKHTIQANKIRNLLLPIGR
jgi:hypothetical protein